MLNGHAAIDGLLDERATTHGDYCDTAAISQQLKAVMRSHDWDSLTLTQRESLDMIAAKIARIISGDASCEDHWNDLAGYATLPLRFR